MDICYNLTNIQNMFCERIRAKQNLFYKSICSLRILNNSKVVLMATSLGTNTVVVARVHCIVWECSAFFFFCFCVCFFIFYQCFVFIQLYVNVLRFGFHFWSGPQHSNKIAFTPSEDTGQQLNSLRCPPVDRLDPWLPTVCPAKTLARLHGCADRSITKTRLYKYIVNFTAENTKIFRWKIVIFFLFLLKI